MSSIVQIDDKLISAEVWEAHFACDLSQCSGICCVLGESGAPLECGEAEVLRREYPHFKHCLQLAGIAAIEAQGFAVTDADGDLCTPLIGGRECAYACFDAGGVCCCGIERAFLAGSTAFRKPVSCWLYPIRLKQLHECMALNYDRQPFCACARTRGADEKIPVFRFLREPLTHRFGKAFYDEMETVYQQHILRK